MRTATSTARYAPPVLQLSHYEDANGDGDEELQIDFEANTSNNQAHVHAQSDLMQYTTQHSDLDFRPADRTQPRNCPRPQEHVAN